MPVYYESQAHDVITCWFFYAFNDAITTYIHSSYCTLPWGSVAQVEAHPVSYSADGTLGPYPTGGGHGLDQALLATAATAAVACPRHVARSRR